MKIMTKTFTKLVLATGFLFFISPLSFSSELSAEELLARMASAGRSLNYSGVFTYEDGGGTVEALKIKHSVIDGVEHEEISHLNGPARNYALPKKDSGCESVGSKLLMAGGSSFKPNANYNYSVRGESRIGGREVDLLKVLPKDEFRYGLTLGLDKETGLLLLAVVASPRKLLERVQFTSLSIDEPASEGSSSSQAAEAENELGSDCPETQTKSASPLAPTWLPPGFTLAAYTYAPKTGHVETYTDGLVSFSVTVQPQVERSNEALQGEAQRGATVIHLALVAVDKVLVQATVIGEIPPGTANRILRSLRPPSKGQNE